MDYRTLAEKSGNLAALLRNLGAVPDDRVGIFVEPSVEAVVGAWGVLLAGAAYLPLSPEYPEDRLRYMIEDARVKIVFCGEGLVGPLTRLAPQGTTIVTMRDAEAFASSRPQAGPRGRHPSLRPENLAYVIYTSGSTGSPKGVMIEHRAIANQMRWLSSAYGLGPGRVVLQKTPMSFDAAQWETLAVGCGATVVAGAPGLHRDPERIIEALVRSEATTLQCVPTLLQALVGTGELHNCTSLTQVFSGGEALTRSLALRFFETLPACGLVNLYGPTECTINSSAFTVGRREVGQGPAAVPIGRPVRGTRYHILDEGRAPVAPGEVGELYIGGVQLARGYLRRPDLTAERFAEDPHRGRLYRTGDLACWNSDGTVQFVGRADNQVKLRGFRVELDEIRLAIEAHDWVRNAAVVVRDDSRTGFQNLVAFVELNPNEAALMDQGEHGAAHHRSKEGRRQVRAQLANLGCRTAQELDGRPVVELPGATPTAQQRRLAFARKTYRFYEGGDLDVADVVRLLGRRAAGNRRSEPRSLGLAELGGILRYFGWFPSGERLLPKYAYASPGSLYGVQMYLEADGVFGLDPGVYYYHPLRHRLVRTARGTGGGAGTARVHLVGRRRAIESVYKNNVLEVLQIEAGHMVGLFEQILPGAGLDVAGLGIRPEVPGRLECADDDVYLATFEIAPHSASREDAPVDLYVQSHPGGRVRGLPPGQYAYLAGRLERISSELIHKRHVIAINQEVYDRSGIGISAVGRASRGWLAYVDLGRTLQRLQMNDLNIGLMSSGYSSATGKDLPSARRLESILGACGRAGGPSYFFVGGRISDEQVRHEGMKEDLVHMRGPAEMIRDDVTGFLPDYMVPNKVVVLDALPLTANGKIDARALRDVDVELADRPFVAPRTEAEERLSRIWRARLGRDRVSVQDDFFGCGGNSLIAVGLVNQVNREFGCALPVQVLFEAPTIERLAPRVAAAAPPDCSRLVRLWPGGRSAPVYCWPGLGGYPMRLRLLARRAGVARPFYGVQTFGVNEGETPFATIEEMAAHDLGMIRRLQPTGPYTLWGYSFGARVALEAALQLERAGEQVENLFLLAPGSPRIARGSAPAVRCEPPYDDKEYVATLFSVFTGSVTDPALARCLRAARDDASFAEFISGLTGLEPALARRIAGVAHATYPLGRSVRPQARRPVQAPVTIFEARGDRGSFARGVAQSCARPPIVVALQADHYGLLREDGVRELAAAIRERARALEAETAAARRVPDRPGSAAGSTRTILKEGGMPHVNIKHFPIPLGEERRSELVAAVTRAVTDAFGCDEGVISIALEPVEQEEWNERVYNPEIVDRGGLLCKVPNY